MSISLGYEHKLCYTESKWIVFSEEDIISYKFDMGDVIIKTTICTRSSCEQFPHINDTGISEIPHNNCPFPKIEFISKENK